MIIVSLLIFLSQKNEKGPTLDKVGPFVLFLF
jgi:hypothetical protein